jgi:hypothetical protein
VLGFVANHIDDVVDRDTADDPIIIVNDRRRQEIAILEFPDYLCRWCMRGDRHDVGRHDARYECIGVVGQ